MSVKSIDWRRYAPYIFGLFMLLLALISFVIFRDLFERPVEMKKQTQEVKVIQAPPPPPPPEEKPPEVKEEKIEEPIPEPEQEPEPAPNEAPPSDQLGVDGDGSAGGDSFGLVGRKGGNGLIGGNGTGNAFIFYGQHVQRELVSELQNSLKDKARNSRYTAVIQIWISPNGDISRVELQNSSGISEIDEALRVAISQIKGRLKPPPERLPQPLKIRIRS